MSQIRCKKCREKIPKGKEVWKTRTPIWNHAWPHTRWWWYSGYFCKKCAIKTGRNALFLLVIFLVWLTILLFGLCLIANKI